MARSIGSQLALRLVTQLTASGVSQWKDQMGPSWRRYATHWLVTVLVIFVTLLLYGLLLIPVNRPIYTVTHDIRVAQSHSQSGTSKFTKNRGLIGDLGDLGNLTQFELSQVVSSARRAGVIQQAVDGLEITDRINESHIEEIKIVTFVDASSGKSTARVKVMGESAADAEKVAKVVGTTLIRYIVTSGNLLQDERDPLAWRNDGPRRSLTQAIAQESDSFQSLRTSWSSFQKTAAELANSTPAATRRRANQTTTDSKDLGSQVPPVNPDWIHAERQLRELRRERADLLRLYPSDRQLAHRMDNVVRDAQATLSRTPLSIVPNSEMPVSGTVAGVRPSVTEEVEVEESDAETADWLELVVNARNHITPMVELHEGHREQLLRKIRAFLPGGAGPTIMIGWSESAPQIVTWGQGISTRRFVQLMFLCVVLSVIVTVWLARVTAMERIHDLRELASSSAIPVIAAVHTGVSRPQAASVAARLAAVWTRRLIHVALLLYIVVFVTASLTPNGSMQSFLQNPREMLGQALLLFSTMS
jgi:hypothetical protein